jgi:hypothetical protein
LKRKNQDGSVVEYCQFAHNEQHPVTRKPVIQIIRNFGRDDQLDRDELVRLYRSNLLNLDVDLIFYDTTTASFHVDQENNPDSRPRYRNSRPWTHGEACRGQVFWDELYILQFYNLRF